MTVAAVTLVLTLALGASGVPVLPFDVAPLADKAIQMSLDQVNMQYGREHLFRITKGSLKKMVPIGMNSQDLIMNFGVRETDCLKSSGSDPLNCNFRRGFFVSEASCYSRVRMSADSAEIISLRCSRAESSSSESGSSEEIRGGSWVYNPFAPRAPVQTAAPLTRGNDIGLERAPFRGDAFNNHLE
ncbi:secreted phosphoprotein 24 [Engraulis encrasicolus]|uniref:secreted phosphoprotein 24 n=1 Tax=Engraulis encrasicolus TaxID=184585 RepID=UPI002FD3998B